MYDEMRRKWEEVSNVEEKITVKAEKREANQTKKVGWSTMMFAELRAGKSVKTRRKWCGGEVSVKKVLMGCGRSCAAHWRRKCGRSARLTRAW